MSDKLVLKVGKGIASGRNSTGKFQNGCLGSVLSTELMALAGQGGAGRREGNRLARSAGLGFQSLKCHVKKLGLPWGSHQEDDLIQRLIHSCLQALGRHR